MLHPVGWSVHAAQLSDTAVAGQERGCPLAERLLTIIRHVDQLVLLMDADALALQLSSRRLEDELISRSVS
jgi:hypothetical protein